MLNATDIVPEVLSGAKVLVTGGAGFIGSNLCDRFLDQDNQVVCLDNFATGHPKNIEPFLGNDNFILLEGDIRNLDDCTRACEGVKYVFHEAALGSVPRSIKTPTLTTDVNVSGFVNMLFAAKEAKVKRFIYAASSSTYGDHKGLPKVEEAIGNPLSPYAVTKLANEFFAKIFYDTYGIETVGLRYFNVYGRRQDPDGAYAAVIPKFILQFINHESPTINGDGNFSRDFTYIEDVIQANQRAALASLDVFRFTEPEDQPSSPIYNVAFGGRTSLNELADIIRSNLSSYDPAIGSIKTIHGKTRQGDVPHSLASIEKARRFLGYHPEYSIDVGLRETCAWYWQSTK